MKIRYWPLIKSPRSYFSPYNGRRSGVWGPTAAVHASRSAHQNRTAGLSHCHAIYNYKKSCGDTYLKWSHNDEKRQEMPTSSANSYYNKLYFIESHYYCRVLMYLVLIGFFIIYLFIYKYPHSLPKHSDSSDGRLVVTARWSSSDRRSQSRCGLGFRN